MNDESPVPRADRNGLVRNVAWSVVALGMVVAAYTFAFVHDRTFFFQDDLPHTLLATIYELGRQLRGGVWPMVQQRTWQSAFVLGDPQYGLFNPVTMLSYALVSREDDVQRGAFLLALAYACLVALGGYTACRTAGVRRSLAALGGASLATAPYVLYWNASTWHMGLVGYCWFVWALAALLVARRNPRRGWLLAVPTYLVFTGGWPTAVVALGLLYVVVGSWDVVVDRVPVRRYLSTALGVMAGAVAGLVPWVVAAAYLPLTARPSYWGGNGFLTMHAEQLVGMFSPITRPCIHFFDGPRVLNQPITFVSVLVATAGALCLLHRRRRLLDRALAVSAGVLWLSTLGPSQTGPMRWPSRFLPFALSLALVTTLVVVSRAVRRRLLPTSVWGFRPLLVPAGLILWLGFTQEPFPSKVLGNAALLAFSGGVLVALIERRRSALAIALAYGVAVAAFVAVVLGPESDFADWGTAGSLAEIEDDVRMLDGQRTVLLANGLNAAVGLTIREVPSGSYALFSRTAGPLIGGYSPVPLRRMSQGLFCAMEFGWSLCPDPVSLLFAVEPRTEVRHIDLLGATQILAQRGVLADTLAASSPAGWHRESTGAYLDRWLRDTPRALPGDVGWVSPGTTIRQDDAGALDVVAPDGGTIVLARPWLPGMRVTLDGRKVPLSKLWRLYARVELPPGASGRLEIGYRLPHRDEVAWLALGGAVLLVASVVVGRRLTRAEA